MKVLFSICFFLFSIMLSAQDSAPLSVIGQSSLSLKPTRTVISYTVNSGQNSYVAAVEDMTKRVDELAAILTKLQFEEDEIVTSTFSIQEKFLYDRGKRINDGYVATQVLRVAFAQDKKRLLEVLSKTTSGLVNAEVGISFTLDDETKDQVELQLIEQAVRDAKTKAETIAKASGYKITGIKEMDYGSTAMPFPKPQLARMEMLGASADAGGAQVSNFEAADLTFSDSVRVIFWIGPSN